MTHPIPPGTRDVLPEEMRELRAIGDVLHDHLFFMVQCGFDAFALREDQDAQEALSVFDTFSDGYQTSVLRPVPLFRRRLATGKS